MTWRLYLAPLALLAPAPLLAQAAPPAGPSATPAPAEAGEIVVEGRRTRDREISRFVDALTPSPVRGQIARYSQPICPGALGLSAKHNQRVTDRMRAVVKAAGAPLDKPGCKANTSLIVTDDKEALAKRIRGLLSKGSVKPVATARSAHAIVLHLEGEVDANGILAGIKEDLGDGDSGYNQVEVFTSDRIRPGTSPSFVASVMIVEPEAIAGLTTLQLADLAAMRLLSKADPARLGGSAPQTILTLLETPANAMAPITLTSWDLAFLRGLYRSEDRTYANRQRGEIQNSMRKDLGVPAPKPKR